MLWWTMQKLKSSNWQVRAGAARVLATSGQPKAVPALVDALDHPVGEERPAVIEALAGIGGQDAVDALISALKNQHIRLKQTREKSTAAVAADEYRALAAALGKCGPAGLNPLIGLLGSEDKDVRRWAARALGLLGDTAALSPLVDRLQDPRSEVKQEAARALGALGDRRALQPLTKVLAGRDPEVRSAAAEALGGLRAEEAVDPLAAAARDANEPLQVAAIEALRKIGGVKAGARIRTIMETARKTVREAAVAALTGMTFDASSPENRASAAVLRGDFDAALREGAASADALTSALCSRDPDYRVKAVQALKTLGSERAVHAMLGALDDSNRGVQEAAAQALASLGTRVLAGLVESLSSEHLSVIALAARALGGIGDAEAVGPLVGTLALLRGKLRNESAAAEAAGEAAAALAGILSKDCARVPVSDLERIVALGEREGAKGTPELREVQPTAGLAEISRAGELAGQELRRRGKG